jgi:hypothetical protein
MGVQRFTKLYTRAISGKCVAVSILPSLYTEYDP